MKVLQINSVCGTGSTGKIVTALHEILTKSGHSCCVAYGRGTAPSHIHSFRIGSFINKYIHALTTRVLDKHCFSSSRATGSLVEYIKAYEPDIIHLHNLHGYYVHIEILFSFLAQYHKPVVWTLHDCWPFTGHCAHFDFVGCRKWKEYCHTCEQTRTYPASYFLDGSKKNFYVKKRLFTSLEEMTLVTPSLWLSELVRDSFLKDVTLKIINNGINLRRFKPTPSDFRKQYCLENKIVLLGVASRWSERKGYSDFIKLASRLTDEYRIVLVGDSSSRMARSARNIISLKRTDCMSTLAKYYSAADAFLNPSYEDTFPTTILEALACGTPVVTYKTGGSIEALNTDTGIIVDKGSIHGLIDAVAKIRDNPFDRASCAAIANKYDKDIVFTEYLKLYERLANNTRRHSHPYRHL